MAGSYHPPPPPPDYGAHLGRIAVRTLEGIFVAKRLHSVFSSLLDSRGIVIDQALDLILLLIN